MKHQKKLVRNPKGLIALVLLAALLLTGCSATPAPQRVSEPASGTILSGYAPKDGSQITIYNSPTAPCVVMLKDTSGRTLISFFVRAGDTVTVDVPAEKMYVHFASGQTWYGEDALFGKETTYSQDEDLTDFTQYTWEYEFDPKAGNNFEYVESDNAPVSRSDPEPVLDDYLDGYIGDLTGQWESVHLQDGNNSLSVSALAFTQTIYNCTEMTVNMNVTMNAGTNCKDWQLWGRSGNSFVKLAKIYLPAGDGYTSQTITFDTPVTFNAIAVTPTIPGGYSWSMGLSVTDVWTNP